MKKKAVIRLEDVWKTYQMGETLVTALKGVSLEIESGNFVSIQGPSGSGKSTLMNMVGCLDVPTKGRVFLDGQDIGKLKESELAVLRGRKIGFVFQAFNLIRTLSARENVMLPMIFQNMPKAEMLRKADKLLDEVGLGERKTHRPTQMSGGEMQRVAIARALANDPEIILADEPTGNLDSKTGEQIMKILIDLHDKGKTLVIVTHDPRIAEFAHKKISIIDGQTAHDHELSHTYTWKQNNGGKREQCKNPAHSHPKK